MLYRSLLDGAASERYRAHRRFAHRMETTMNFMKAIVAAGVVAASTSAFAADITGAGATFPFPLYSKWADAYKKETGNGLNYQSIGSGAGIKQIQAKTVTFGASDMPLKPEQLEKDGMIQWPQAMGALVPVVNLEGVKPGWSFRANCSAIS